MKLIYIYGNPGSGKLTIAKELSKQTNYRLLHHHLVIDMLTEVLNFKHESFWTTAKKVFINVLKGLKEQNQNVIITNVYTEKEDSSMKEQLELAEETLVVRLKCGDEEILKRIENKDRKCYGKICDKESFLNWKKQQLKEEYEGTDLTLETDKLSVKEAVEEIINFLY